MASEILPGALPSRSDDLAESRMLRNSETLVLIGIVMLALVLRLPGFTESLWNDEVWSTRIKLRSVVELARILVTDIHPPFYRLVMFGWIRLFGESEISVRMLPLVCGLLTIVLTAHLAVTYGGRRAAPVAALVLAISPVHIWYSQEAQQYSFLLLLLVLCTWAFHQIRQTNAKRWYVAYAILAPCLLLTHYFAFAYVAAITLLSLGDHRLRWRMLWIGLAAAAPVALLLAVKWRLGELATEAGYLRAFTPADLWGLPFEWFAIGGSLESPSVRSPAVRVGVLIVQLALLGLVARGVWHAGCRAARNGPDETRWSCYARRGELALLLLVLPLALLTLSFVGARQFYLERSALMALPFFAIALAVGVASLHSAASRAAARALIVGFGAVVLVNYYAKGDEWTVYKPNPDWRTAARWLSTEHARTGQPLVVVSVVESLELLYYERGFATRKLDTAPNAVRAVRSGTESLRERLKRAFPIPTDRGQTGRIYALPAPEPSFVHAVLDREKASEFFLARNAYWTATSDRLIDALGADGSFRIESAFEAKGIRLFRVRQLTQNAHH